MPSMSMPQQLPPVKQEPYIKTEPLSQLPSVSQPYHPQPSFYSQQQQESQAKGELTPLPNVSQPYHPPPPFCQQQQQQQGSSYSSNHQYGQQSHQSYSSPSSSSSSNGPMASFSNLASSGNYNLSRHIMAMNMHQNPAVSSASTAVPSGTTTPVVPNTHLNTSAFSSAPSSPTLNNMQYHPNGGNSHLNSNVNSNVNSNSNSGSNSPYVQHQSYAYQSQQQQQQQHSYSHQTSHSSDLNSNNYYNSSPPYASQQQQQQQQQPQQSQPHHGGANVGGNAAHVQFSSTAPSPMRQHQQSQYAALVPPLSDSQYAQYRQLLGSSAFSSTQSTPYHSNHSTPYSSMPGSPTHEYQQLNEAQLSQKPKRRQVKNACVNCQKACKKCDEGRPCARCIKYGLTETCVDSTRKVRKKGVKRGPYKRRPPPTQIGSASAVTTPTMRNAVPSGVAGYMSEPVTALNSPTQSHMLPFTSTAGSATTMAHMPAPLDFGYDTSGGPSYSFHSQRMESSYGPSSYTTGYPGSSIYGTAYGMNGSNNGSNGNPNSSSGNMS